MNKARVYSEWIKQEAAKLGFEACGISKAEFLDSEARRLEEYLRRDYHGTMAYMAKHFDMRLDPRLLVPGAKSVISLWFNYYPSAKQFEGAPKLAKYAYGQDYHKVLKDKLYDLIASIRAEIGEIDGRVFVDSAPVLERAWAAKSGLGWIGKNGNLIRRGRGSFAFLAELIVDLELEPDTATTDHCGTCTRCMDSCPTEAIVAPKQVDGSKCISYFTIELRDAIPDAMKGKFEDWMFGCDICQDVCPWNRKPVPHTEALFEPAEGLMDMGRSDWEELTEEVFARVFKKSAVKRTKFSGLTRNIAFLVGAKDKKADS